MRIRLVVPWLVLVLAAGALAGTEGAEPAPMPDPAQARESQQQAASIEVRPTFGPGGSTRPAEVIAGEELNLAVTVSNVGVSGTDEWEYVFEIDIVTPGGVVQRAASTPLKGRFAWGETSVHQNHSLQFPRTYAPGDYQIRLRARDSQDVERAAKTIRVAVRPDTTFGAINLRLFHDVPHSCPARGVFAVGGQLGASYQIVGLDTTADEVSVEMAVSVLDDAGQIVTSRRHVDVFQDRLTPAKRRLLSNGLDGHFELKPPRPGTFRLRLELKDKVGNQSASYEVPIVVLPSP